MTREEYYKLDLEAMMRESFIEGIDFALKKVRDINNTTSVKEAFNAFYTKFMTEEVTRIKDKEE